MNFVGLGKDPHYQDHSFGKLAKILAEKKIEKKHKRLLPPALMDLAGLLNSFLEEEGLTTRKEQSIP